MGSTTFNKATMEQSEHCQMQIASTRFCLLDPCMEPIEARHNARPIQCVPEKRKPTNQVNLSENGNDLSEKVYIVSKFILSSFV